MTLVDNARLNATRQMTTQQRIRNAVIILLIAAFVVYATRDGKEPTPVGETDSHPPYVVINGRTMGTTYSIKYYPIQESRQDAIVKKKVEEVLAEINRQMSTYDSESELSRFNLSQTTDWFDVSASTVEVVSQAMETSQLSDGKFDPTVGPLVKLWNFGPGREKFEVPANDVIKAAMRRIGYQKVQVRIDPPALKKSDPEIYLDLSAIAKGYAVDRVSDALAELELKTHLVEIGGEMRCLGRKPGGELWSLAVEKPTEGFRGIQKSLLMTNCAIATSGNYRNFYIENGKRFSHTIDPETGRPVRHQLASATVIAENWYDCRCICDNADGSWPGRWVQLGNRKGGCCSIARFRGRKNHGACDTKFFKVGW